jgi:hypothetical protein
MLPVIFIAPRAVERLRKAGPSRHERDFGLSIAGINHYERNKHKTQGQAESPREIGRQGIFPQDGWMRAFVRLLPYGLLPSGAQSTIYGVLKHILQRTHHRLCKSAPSRHFAMPIQKRIRDTLRF